MAASTLKESDSYLGARFRSLRGRLGPGKAIKAMAAHLARLIYRMLTHGQDWVDRGAEVLTFAKNASAGMSLRCNAFITVMETAELRDLDDFSDTRHRSRKWALLVQSQVGPRPMVVDEI